VEIDLIFAQCQFSIKFLKNLLFKDRGKVILLFLNTDESKTKFYRI